MWFKCLLREFDECISKISGIHMIPNVLPITQGEGPAVVDYSFNIDGNLDTAFLDWPMANAKDEGSTQDSRWDGILGAST